MNTNDSRGEAAESEVPDRAAPAVGRSLDESGFTGSGFAGSGSGSRDSGSSSKHPETIPSFQERKSSSRRQQWQFNFPLLIKSSVIVAVVIAAAAGSYVYHSSKTAVVFAARAEDARQRGDHLDESQWLRRYLLLSPDDTEAIVRTGMAADEAVADAPSQGRGDAINQARRSLSNALATMGDGSLEESQQLRRRLIRRLIQLGGSWMAEAERQVILLDAPSTDAAVHEFLAMAKVGQLDDNPAAAGDVEFESVPASDDNYWSKLASRPAAQVLQKAPCSTRPILI